MSKKWWNSAIGYQIYPRSFQDTNGDGIGDINGITQHLDDLVQLGINLLWICPVFKSPMVDNGYDISDYYAIDETFGTMQDMDELIKQADKRGIKILLDLVVNHTSDKHEWFQKALSEPNGKYGKYYVIKEGVDGNEPNNWRSIFGGSAWGKIGNSNLYYLHLFNKEQPDLNWENPEMRADIYKMINWWLDKGISGFRIDAITHIKKNYDYVNHKPDGDDGYYFAWENINNVDGIGDILTEMKSETFAKHDCLTIAEANDVSADKLKHYIGDDGYFSTIFDFCHNQCYVRLKPWSTQPSALLYSLREKMFDCQEEAGDNFIVNVLENHDLPRAANRLLPQNCINDYSIKMLACTNFFLHGIPFLYQGQAIGMTDYPKSAISEYVDAATYGGYKDLLAQRLSEADALEYTNITCRENGRTPMQWDITKNAGFTSGNPWFAVNPNYKEINYEAEKRDESSLLNFYKQMINLRKRKDLADIFIYGKTIPRFNDKNSPFIAYERYFNNKRVLVICSFSSKSTSLEITGIKEIALTNYDCFDAENILPFQAAVLVIE